MESCIHDSTESWCDGEQHPTGVLHSDGFESCRFIHTKKRGGRKPPLFWCGRQDSNFIFADGKNSGVPTVQPAVSNTPPGCCIQMGSNPVVSSIPKKEEAGSLLFFGAGDRTRTCTPKQRNLNPPSLPIPPRPHLELF